MVLRACETWTRLLWNKVRLLRNKAGLLRGGGLPPPFPLRPTEMLRYSVLLYCIFFFFWNWWIGRNVGIIIISNYILIYYINILCFLNTFIFPSKLKKWNAMQYCNIKFLCWWKKVVILPMNYKKHKFRLFYMGRPAASKW